MTLLLLLFACRTPAAPPPSDFWDGHATKVVGSKEGPMCTVVAIHGRGANEHDLEGLFDRLDFPVQVVLPRAPDPVREGSYSWFMISRDTDPEVLAKAVDAQAERLVTGLASMPTARPVRGKPIITGFSQGGMLSFAAAALHPDAFSASLPLSGFLPEPSWPDGKGAVPITAFHGEADPVLPFRLAVQTTDHLEKAGWDVTLKRYPGVRHRIAPSMFRDWQTALKAACQAQ